MTTMPQALSELDQLRRELESLQETATRVGQLEAENAEIWQRAMAAEAKVRRMGGAV